MAKLDLKSKLKEKEQIVVTPESLIALRLKKDELKEELKQVECDLKQQENAVLSLIDKGQKFNWCWKWIYKKTNISWKEVVIENLGKKFADKILAETPQDEYPKLGIEGLDPRPKEDMKAKIKSCPKTNRK